MARRQRRRPGREAGARQHQFLLRRQDALGRPHQVRAREGLARAGRPQHGALVHQGLPRARAAGHRAHDRDVRRQRPGRLHRLRRGDPRHGFPRLQSARHGADSGHRRQARSGDAAGRGRGDRRARSKAPRWQRSTPLTSPISSSRRPSPTPCSTSCSKGDAMDDKRTPRARHGQAPQGAGRCLGRPLAQEQDAVQRRISGFHHPLRLGRALERGRITTSAPAAFWSSAP